MNLLKEEKRACNLSKQFSKKNGFNFFMGKYRIKTILDNCRGRDKTLLDLGCSYGKIAKEISPFFKKIVAVDGSAALIKQAKKENSAPNICYQKSLVENLKLNEKFDVILLSFILEHVAEPISLLKKASSFLKKDGQLFIMVPNAESLHRRVGKEMGIIKKLDEVTQTDKNHGHRRVYTMGKLVNDIKKAGLKLNKLGTFFIKPFSNSQMEKISPEVCDALFEAGKSLPGLGSMIFASVCKK